MMWDFKDKGEATDIRFTSKGNRLFAFLLDWPEDGVAVIALPNIKSFQSRLFRGKWFHLDPPRHLFFFK